MCIGIGRKYCCDIGRGRIKGRVWWWTGDCDIKADGGVGAGVVDEGWG